MKVAAIEAGTPVGVEWSRQQGPSSPAEPTRSSPIEPTSGSRMRGTPPSSSNSGILGVAPAPSSTAASSNLRQRPPSPADKKANRAPFGCSTSRGLLPEPSQSSKDLNRSSISDVGRLPTPARNSVGSTAVPKQGTVSRPSPRVGYKDEQKVTTRFTPRCRAGQEERKDTARALAMDFDCEAAIDAIFDFSETGYDSDHTRAPRRSSSRAAEEAGRTCGSGRVRRLSRTFQERFQDCEPRLTGGRAPPRAGSRDPLGASSKSLREEKVTASTSSLTLRKGDGPRGTPRSSRVGAPPPQRGNGNILLSGHTLGPTITARKKMTRASVVGAENTGSDTHMVVASSRPTVCPSAGDDTGAPRRLARSDTVPPKVFRNSIAAAGCDGSPTPQKSCTPRSKMAFSPASASPRSLGGTFANSPQVRSPPRESSVLDDAFGPWARWTDAALPSATAAEPTATALFEVFRTAEDLRTTMAAFAQLFRQARLASLGARAPDHRPIAPPWAAGTQPWRFPYEPIRVLLGGHWKAKMLWEKMDARCTRPEYASAPCAGGPFAGRRVVVVGAGPCGLLAAIELRLLGAQVTVLEQRERFTRLNRLHLWTWCGEELKALGARCLEPPPLDFGSDPDLLHVGIAEIQTLLLKTSLLLGVQVILGATYCGVKWGSVETGGWHVNVRHGSRSESKSPGGDGKGQLALHGVAMVVGAGGLACSVGRTVGLESNEVGSLRAEEAIGLVCNFAPSQGGTVGGDRSLRSFSLARQFYEKLFHQLESETGAVLENIVYTRSKASHYFVMTPTRRCLEECGVLRDPSHRPMLDKSNVDREALDEFIRRIVAFRFRDGQATLPEAMAASQATVGEGPAKLCYADHGPQLFDFSKMKRAGEGLAFLSPPASVIQAEEYHLLVALAGDALVEPFWPEGLGVARGFHAAQDVAYAASRWGPGVDRSVVTAEFAASYGQLKSLAAASRCRVLRDDESKYTIDPGTRYRGISSAVS